MLYNMSSHTYRHDPIAGAYAQPGLSAMDISVDIPGGGVDAYDGIVLDHARYKAHPPRVGYNVFLTKAVRHMTPEQARAVAADLVRLADYADALRDARVDLKRAAH